LGAPLKKSDQYQLVVSRNWKDAEGIALQKDVLKNFVAGNRDSISPVTANWKVVPPAQHSSDALTIIPDEPLDHYLFAESIILKDSHGKVIKGRFETGTHDHSCRFIPESKWAAGDYLLTVDARLEDLAGNNLTRPFDRDLMQTTKAPSRQCCEMSFSIQ
jgi:hypothetical protein